MTGRPLAFESAAALGRRIASREVSPVEVVRDALDRIERIDPALNSFITRTAEIALATASAAEQEIAASGPRGPLHGVPMALKDIFDTAGVETANGTRVFAGRVPDADAAVVERLRRAGTVLLGKLNMHEIAAGITNNNVHYGPCRNPWNPERVPGGSSGGSAVALAARLCHVSLGTDTGGSIRLPAGACGIVGLKPTFGRVNRRGVFSLAWTLDHVGPMTRTVEDAALVLNEIAGHDPADPWSATEPTTDYRADLELGVGGLRVGVPSDLFFDGVDPDVERAVRAAIDVLAREGATLVDVPLPTAVPAAAVIGNIIRPEAYAYHERWVREKPGDYGDEALLRLELGAMVSAVDYVNARRVQMLLRQEMADLFRRVDVLAVPTLPFTAPPIESSPNALPTRPSGRIWNDFMTPFNMSGSPAISVPCGFGDDGLPVGLQIAGRAFDEATVLRAARAYERATDWHERAPAIA